MVFGVGYLFNILNLVWYGEKLFVNGWLEDVFDYLI